MREQICTDKHPWGTDVYTDDSDPVAAAVHSSWLRGEWDESLDVHNIIGEPKPEVAMQTNTALDAVPQRPVLPLYGEDAHITLSILPPLERRATESSSWTRAALDISSAAGRRDERED
ncbi:hypothetical protein LTR66_008422 [Elasticomyces elasticus]|nr:hypothetical protein LTR66_008422 [Elasticomyces elasticus]